MKQRILMIGFLVALLLLVLSGMSWRSSASLRGGAELARSTAHTGSAVNGGAHFSPHLGVTDLTYESHAVDDDGDGDSIGNGDGELDCGETVELYVGINNGGSLTVMFVDAAIITSDPYITWTGTTSAFYGDIMGGETVTNTEPFDFMVDCAAPAGHEITFTLDITGDVPGEDVKYTYDSFSDSVSQFDADVNGSGCVDVTDVSDVAADWRCAVGDLCYQSHHDLDGDGTITVVDLMKVAAYWGWCCL